MNLEDQLAAARARGAVIVRDDIPGQGFADDDTHDPRYDDPLVVDAAKRAEDAAGKVLAEVDELTQSFREGNVNAVRRFRFNFQQEYTEWVPGRILNLGQFLPMLQRIRPDAFVSEYQILGLRGLGFIVNGQPQYSGTAIQDVAPEWSQIRVDARGLPTTPKYRGWRTVLLTCIHGGFLTEDQCDITFGKPFGPRSRPWYRQLYAIRNGVCGECHKVQCECGAATAWERLRADNYTYDIPQQVAEGKRQEAYESKIYVP